jgi:diaminopimelate decarboxylase
MFSTDSQMQEIAKTYGTPLLVYDESSLKKYASDTLNVPNVSGLTVRYSMKANSHSAILQIFDSIGIHIDASSYFEVKRAINAGISPEKIMLTSQTVLPKAFIREVVEQGVIYCCTSLNQLRNYCELYAGGNKPVSIRINPGLGSGHNNRTNTAGPAASFGIWYQYITDIHQIVSKHNMKISRIHTHVGSGSDWKIWKKAAVLTLRIVREFPDVDIVNLGGGYKIDRMDSSKSIDLDMVFSKIKQEFKKFSDETGRNLHLEIEPGTYLTANTCILLSTVNDIVSTGTEGFRFIKADASMSELLRPMIYGANHPLRILGKENGVLIDYAVVGCCCESGDIFTVAEGNPEVVNTVKLPQAEIGDILAIMGAGAYGISMSAKNYNSRPICAEVMIRTNGSHSLISRQQKIEEIWDRELPFM